MILSVAGHIKSRPLLYDRRENELTRPNSSKPCKVRARAISLELKLADVFVRLRH